MNLSEIEIKRILKSKLNVNRFTHTLSVQDLAVRLAKVYKIDESKARLTGLLHYCAKWMSPEKLMQAVEHYGIELDEIERRQSQILHAIVGAYWAKDYFHMHDEEILRAIKLHTTGDVQMSLLDKVIYVADYAEPTREYSGAKQIYELAFEDIDRATLETANQKILYLIKKGALIHPKTIRMRNAMVLIKRDHELH